MTTEVRKTVTVVFSDVTGSTSIGERIDPEPLRGLLTRYYDEMKQVLERHGGAVRELVGDAMLAVFGAPVAHEDDALRAVRAAYEMSERLAELNDELERDWGVRLATCTGINTGEVVVEGPETEQPLVLGDSINVAARLEQSAEPGEILLGDATYRLVRDAVEVEAVEPLELKGKSQPVPAWRLLELMPLRPGLARRLDSALVGREQELALLREAFERGGSQLVTVLGPAGVGKSRLTQEFVAGLGESATALMGRCLPYGEGITFWPVAEVVRAAAEMSETDAPETARGKIAALLDGEDDAEQVAERVAAAIGLVESAAELQEIFWAIRKLLEALARERPLVCVFDDVDWAEPTFLDLIEHLAGRTHDVPLLLLCLARPELLEVRPSWPSDTSIVLDALSEDDSGQLIASLLGADALPDEVSLRVGAAAEGNPLFVEELIRMLVDDGLLERENGTWRATGDLTELALPASINALLAARLDRLAPAEREVIQRASVIGKVFWWGAVAELSPEDVRPEVGGHLQTLVRKELVRPDMSSFAGEDGFRFGHILVRDAAYQSIPKATRAELHERFADWLERKAGERASEYEEIIGYHLEQAVRHRTAIGPASGGLGIGLRAGQRLASAGLRARARGDMAAADNLLSRAVVLLPADGAERLELLPKLADALVETGQLERAEGALSEALEQGEPLAGLELATLTTYTGGDAGQAEIAELAREAIPLLERAGNDAALARAWELLSDVHAIACLWGERAEALERALRHARRADDKRAEAQLLAALAVSLYLGSTPAREGTRRCEEILERTDARGVEGSVLGALAGFRAMQGSFDEARELYSRGQSIYDDLGLKLRAAARTMIGGRIEVLAGDLPAAERELRSGLETLEAMGEQNILSTVAGLLARVIYPQGRYEEAEELAEVSERAAADDDVISQVLWRAARATALARRGEASEAESLAHEAVRRIEQTDQLDNHGDTLLDLAEVLRLGGREDEAAPIVADALKLYEQKENLVSAERARAVLQELSGAAPQ